MNHKKMLEDIDNLVGTDFVGDMHFKAFAPKTTGKFSKEEIKKMVQILVDVYRIAHSVHCKSCGVEYKKWNEADCECKCPNCFDGNHCKNTKCGL